MFGGMSKHIYSSTAPSEQDNSHRSYQFALDDLFISNV